MDTAGRGSVPALIDLTGGPQQVITLADRSAGKLGVRYLAGEPDAMPTILAEVAALVADGTISLPIAGTYALEDVATAHRDSQAGHVRGKLILLPRPVPHGG
jgi:NADPH:quinone reductase-like Zn-dependent oxidoreductase